MLNHGGCENHIGSQSENHLLHARKERCAEASIYIIWKNRNQYIYIDKCLDTYLTMFVPFISAKSRGTQTREADLLIRIRKGVIFILLFAWLWRLGFSWPGILFVQLRDRNAPRVLLDVEPWSRCDSDIRFNITSTGQLHCPNLHGNEPIVLNGTHLVEFQGRQCGYVSLLSEIWVNHGWYFFWTNAPLSFPIC